MRTDSIYCKMFAAVAAAAVLTLTGCAGFFVPTSGTTTTGSSGNNVYVANAVANSLAGFAIGTGTLTAVKNSPYSLSFSPTSVVVTPANTFVYVGGAGLVYAYAINTDGSLTIANSGAAVASVSAAAMDISPDGNWLFVLDTNGTTLEEYQINKTTGLLTAQAPNIFATSAGTNVAHAVRVSPNGALVFAAVGPGGDRIFTFNTTTGAIALSQQLVPTLVTSDNAIAIDKNTAYAFIARSGTAGTGVAVYTIGAGGALTSVAGSPFAAGSQPYSVVLNVANNYVYVANRGDGTISAYTLGTGGVLTPVTNSPFASGNSPVALAADSTGKYIFAASLGGAPDLSMYAFDSTVAGRIFTTTSTATSTTTSNATAVATTH